MENTTKWYNFQGHLKVCKDYEKKEIGNGKFPMVAEKRKIFWKAKILTKLQKY